MARHSGPQIYFPDTLNEVLHILRRTPEALIYAGGTYLLSRRRGRFVELPDVMVSLQDVQELQRTSRTERAIDIGATVPIAEIVRLGPAHLPEVLFQTAGRMVPAGVRGIATLGGNLAVPDGLMTAVPALALLDARVETRRVGSTRWMPVGQLHDADGSLAIDPGTLISRIRVPVSAWSHSSFFRDGNELLPESDPLTFCAVARTNNGILDDVRVAGTVGGPTLIRKKDAEGELAGRRLPIPLREARSFAAELIGGAEHVSELQHYRLTQLAVSFIVTLR